MTLLDRLSERIGDFLEDVMLPEEIRTLHRKARQAMEEGNYDKALQWLGEAEHRRPNTETTRRMRALCHFHLENTERALELFREALELREEAASHFHLALCLEREQRFEEARAHLQRARELDDDPPFAYELHFALGRVHLARNRPDKAARELRRALRLWPDQPDAMVTLGKALYLWGRYGEAAEVVSTAIDEDGAGIRDGLTILGHIESSRGHYDAAVEAFEAVLDDHPDDYEALLGAARAYLSMGRPAQANRHLIRALGGAEDDADIYALIGETNQRIRNFEKALESYTAALRRDPEHAAALAGAGQVALRLERYEEAAIHYEALLDLPAPQYRPQALLGLGRCRLALGDPAGARHLLEEADQLHRKRPPELLHALGQVALDSDDPAEALVAFRRALHADPNDELRSVLEADVDRSLHALRPHWHRPSTFESTSDLVATLTDLLDCLRAEPRLEDFLPRVHDLLTALDSPLSVAILGEFNAGKSTLVNAILGEEVVPMGVLPTTAHPCIMGYGPRKGVRVIYEDGSPRDVDFAAARRLMKEEAERIARLDYTYPHPELRSINYWDTPGFNALDERHESLAKKALQDSEAILWLVDANQALKETEFSKLRSIPDSELRVVLVLNKIDRFGPPDQRSDDVEEVVQYLQDNAGDQVLGILAISALEALRARTGDDEEVAGDFERLMELLDREFVQRSWRIKIAEVSRALDVLLTDINEYRSSQIERFRGLVDQARKLGDLIDDAAGDPHRRASEYAMELEDHFDFVVMGIEREITGALRRRGNILRRLVLEQEDREFALELLGERLDHVIDRCRRDVLREVGDIEARLAEHLSPLLAALSVTDARPLRRRLEGFFDETRALKTLLDERVFGQWRARSEGQITTGGDRALDAIVDLGEETDGQGRRELLAGLIPPVGDDFSQALATWYEEFFLAAKRFSDRLQRDLTTLELEVRHRLDFDGSTKSDDPDF